MKKKTLIFKVFEFETAAFRWVWVWSNCFSHSRSYLNNVCRPAKVCLSNCGYYLSYCGYYLWRLTSNSWKLSCSSEVYRCYKQVSIVTFAAVLTIIYNAFWYMVGCYKMRKGIQENFLHSVISLLQCLHRQTKGWIKEPEIMLVTFLKHHISDKYWFVSFIILKIWHHITGMKPILERYW